MLFGGSQFPHLRRLQKTSESSEEQCLHQDDGEKYQITKITSEMC